MPGLLPSLEISPGIAVGSLTVDLDQLPVAALIRRDRHCLAQNGRLRELLGDGRDHELDAAMLGSDGLQSSACREVLLRGAGGEGIAATMLSLPVTHEQQPALLCLLLQHDVHGWRNADLASAIDDVIREDMQWFSAAVMERLARCRPHAASGLGLRQLTPREREILAMVCEGRNDASIAFELGISRNTLRNHLANIYGKAGVRRRSEVVVWGRERGVTAF